jgi:hypothetical protein
MYENRWGRSQSGSSPEAGTGLQVSNTNNLKIRIPMRVTGAGMTQNLSFRLGIHCLLQEEPCIARISSVHSLEVPPRFDSFAF